jgi:hypothetical protein
MLSEPDCAFAIALQEAPIWNQDSEVAESSLRRHLRLRHPDVWQAQVHDVPVVFGMNCRRQSGSARTSPAGGRTRHCRAPDLLRRMLSCLSGRFNVCEHLKVQVSMRMAHGPFVAVDPKFLHKCARGMNAQQVALSGTGRRGRRRQRAPNWVRMSWSSVPARSAT